MDLDTQLHPRYTPIPADEVQDGLSVQPVHQSDALDIPHWSKQLTIRSFIVSAFVGGLLSIVTHKVNLTTGLRPSLNVAAGLLGFFFIKCWTGVLSKLGFWVTPFTRQENAVVQTCVVACYGIAFSGGFGSYLIAMDETSYELVGSSYEGNTEQDVKNPSLGWMTAFLMIASFLGIFCLVPFRKIMIVDFKLIFPSGVATALLINSFHTETGAAVASKQVKCLGKYFTISFLWSFFKWFFSGAGDSCGFDNFPSLGLKAYENSFYFDFSPIYVGTGMICPHIVNFSLLLGSILSWGILWPLISTKAGDWYPDNLESTSFKGLYGYKIFAGIAMILGDGFYNLVKLLVKTARLIFVHYRIGQPLPSSDLSEDWKSTTIHMDEQTLNNIFMKERIPLWGAVSGYLTLAAIAVGVIPLLFPASKWYYVLLCYVVAPAMAFCNAHGTGLTNWNFASTYAKLMLFIFASWAGSNGGVIVGLVACGLIFSVVAVASDLMQDLKTGYLTCSSPRSMFISQLAGTFLGCILAPLTFWMFWTSYDIGAPDGVYKAPFGLIYREIALVGTQGFSELPSHCLEICCGCFAFSVLLSVLRDTLPLKVSRFIPIPMAMGMPFYYGAYFAIDMCVGSAIVFVWERLNQEEADIYAGAVASGLICGDGTWTIPSSLLSLCNIDPPICMSFTST